MARRNRSGVSWELVGIVTIMGIFIVGGLFWLVERQGAEPVASPLFMSLDPNDPIENGQTDDGRPYMGKADAPVTIYEFADFQCPHCREFSRTTAADVKSELLATGKARLVWVNYPILGDESTQAAKGATCATEQGQFWTYHDWLFANQTTARNSGAFSETNLNAMAAAIPDIDAAAFAACLTDGATADLVKTDQEFGAENSVQQTPSFLIGDSVIVGGTLEELSAAVSAAGG